MNFRHCSRIVGFLVFIAFTVASPQNVHILSGKITDSASGEPLAAANVRIAGTSRGTIANIRGEYRLASDEAQQVIVYSYLGYAPETLRVSITGDLIHDVRLVASPIRLPEVLVVAEDPAVGIIRKAIANKRKWMEKLTSYRFEAFTRQVLRRDTAIASIAEAYTTGYMLIGDTLRETVTQKRQTQNLPLDQNFAAVRSIVNFNEDDISLFGVRINNVGSAYEFIGPTAPAALDYYEYTLLNTKDVGGIEVYQIRMKPKTRLRPLFDGTITIADGTFAVMGVDLQPNEAFTIPFTKDIQLRYRQEFALYDSIFWMPTNVRITGGFAVGVVGFSMPRIGLDITSTLYDYKVNIEVPDTVLRKQRLSVDSSSVTYDSTFWRTRDVLPLTEEEESAYRTLDSAQTLERQFQPTGPLASFGGNGDSFSFLNYIDARFNRVEGFYVGGKLSVDSMTTTSRFFGSVGIGFSNEQLNYVIGLEFFTSPNRTVTFGVEYHRSTTRFPEGGYYGDLYNSLTALIDKNDYGDYYLARGIRAYTIYSPSQRFKGTLSLLREDHASLRNTTNYGFLSRAKPFRQNPPAQDGPLRSGVLEVRIGEKVTPFDLITRDALEFSVELSPAMITNGPFDFFRAMGAMTWNARTFSRSLLFAPTIRVKASAGTSSGSLPPQRIFVLDSRSSGYAPFGVLRGSMIREFAGTRFLMVNVEHNFRNVPWLALDIPFLYQNNIDLIVHGSVAQTWWAGTTFSSGWYTEAGIGVGRIFDLVRADITYRFKQPSGFWFSLSVASIF
jgi:hypothetical protein